MSDILFLATKEFDGKALDGSGTITTTGELCFVNVPTGKTFYLAYANAWITDMSAGLDHATIELQEDNTAIDTQIGQDKIIGVFSSANDNLQEQGQLSAMDLFSEFKGKQIFSNISGSDRKVKLRVTAISGASNVHGTIRGWIEDNGVDPSI